MAQEETQSDSSVDVDMSLETPASSPDCLLDIHDVIDRLPSPDAPARARCPFEWTDVSSDEDIDLATSQQHAPTLPDRETGITGEEAGVPTPSTGDSDVMQLAGVLGRLRLRPSDAPQGTKPEIMCARALIDLLNTFEGRHQVALAMQRAQVRPPSEGEPHAKPVHEITLRTVEWCTHHEAWRGVGACEPRAQERRRVERLKADKVKYKQEMAKSRRKVPPKNGEPTSKIIDGKTVHWCKHHKKWMAHTSRECRLGLERQAERPKVRDVTGPEGACVASTCADCVEVHPDGHSDQPVFAGRFDHGQCRLVSRPQQDGTTKATWIIAGHPFVARTKQTMTRADFELPEDPSSGSDDEETGSASPVGTAPPTAAPAASTLPVSVAPPAAATPFVAAPAAAAPPSVAAQLAAAAAPTVAPAALVPPAAAVPPAEAPLQDDESPPEPANSTGGSNAMRMDE